MYIDDTGMDLEAEIDAEGQCSCARIAVHHCLIGVQALFLVRREQIEIVDYQRGRRAFQTHFRQQALRQAVCQCDIGQVEVGPVVQEPGGIHRRLRGKIGHLRELCRHAGGSPSVFIDFHGLVRAHDVISVLEIDACIGRQCVTTY